MTESHTTNPPDDAVPSVWLIDSDREPLATCRQALSPWANICYFPDESRGTDWNNPPDVILFSAEIAGGANGRRFEELLGLAGPVPLVAVARLRSLTQALSYFRAGAVDYLTLPLDPDDVRERVDAAMDRASAIAMQGMMVELEPVDADPGVVSLSLSPTANQSPDDDEVDILARLSGEEQCEQGVEPPAPPLPRPIDDEPVAVDGLPIPSLWDELPCGLLVFDSSANLVFANQPALELFGSVSVAHLEDALENNRAGFNAYTSNNKPLPDNQWPHVLAVKARTARSALISIEKADKRRSWLRIDCLPHLHGGAISRVLLTAVNLTGDLPPLVVRGSDGDAPFPAGASPGKKAKTRKKGKK